MKIIYLVRHAKSSWKELALKDFERPLNKRGERDAPFMGQKLKDQGILPHLLISSPAKRAKRTAKAIAKMMGYSVEKITFNQAIYEATESSLLSIIQQQEDIYASLMLVGHNPELTALSNMLSDYQIYNIPTCGVSCIKFDVLSWQEVVFKSGEHVFFDYPKRYLQR